MSDLPVIAIGGKITGDEHDALLGKTIVVDGVTYMLVHATSAITSAQNVMLTWASAASGTVDAVAAAAAERAACAGIAQLPSANADSGDRFYVARKGRVTATTEAAVAAETALAVHGSSGALDDTTVTAATTVAHSLDAVGSGTTATILIDLP